jgi:hypothetical protein
LPLYERHCNISDHSDVLLAEWSAGKVGSKMQQGTRTY